jgi:hypothetical protein
MGFSSRLPRFPDDSSKKDKNPGSGRFGVEEDATSGLEDGDFVDLVDRVQSGRLVQMASSTSNRMVAVIEALDSSEDTGVEVMEDGVIDIDGGNSKPFFIEINGKKIEVIKDSDGDLVNVATGQYVIVDGEEEEVMQQHFTTPELEAWREASGEKDHDAPTEEEIRKLEDVNENQDEKDALETEAELLKNPFGFWRPDDKEDGGGNVLANDFDDPKKPKKPYSPSGMSLAM